MTHGAGLDADLDAAAELLREARQALVYGLSDSTVEAQRAALALAARVGAIVDTPASAGHAGAFAAFEHLGAQTASLGELRRADLVVAWGGAPAGSPAANIAVDIGPARGPHAAETRLALRPDQALPALLALRAFVRGRRVEARAAAGLPLDALRALASRLTSARYAVVCAADASGDAAQDGECDEALAALVRECHRKARVRLVRSRSGGNPVGADNVLTWRSGAPASVRFGPAGPVYGPGEFSAEALLLRRDVDLVMLVGARLDALSSAARVALDTLPRIELGAKPRPGARLAFATAALEATPGHVFRSDGVVLRRAPARAPGRPTEAEVLEGVLARIAAGGEA